jgi:hypothetical protein
VGGFSRSMDGFVKILVEVEEAVFHARSRCTPPNPE